MKKFEKMGLFYLNFIILPFIISCDKQESYTLNGRFLNGTTNMPYSRINVKAEKIVGATGFSNSSIIGNTITDENGNFEFSYTTKELEKGTITLYFEDNGISALYQKGGIVLQQDNNLTFYLSDSANLWFKLNTDRQLSAKERLWIKTNNGLLDTLINLTTLENINNIFKFRMKYSDYIVADVKRINIDTVLGEFTPKNAYAIEGDPVINEITVKY